MTRQVAASSPRRRMISATSTANARCSAASNWQPLTQAAGDDGRRGVVLQPGDQGRRCFDLGLVEGSSPCLTQQGQVFRRARSCTASQHVRRILEGAAAAHAMPTR